MSSAWLPNHHKGIHGKARSLGPRSPTPACPQAERDAFKGQRDLHAGLSQQLSLKLREAAYALAQLQAGAEGPVLSLARRSLLDAAAQTQHCELWLRNACAGEAAGSSSSSSDAAAGTAEAAVSAEPSGGAGQAEVAAGEEGTAAQPALPRLSLADTLALIQQVGTALHYSLSRGCCCCSSGRKEYPARHRSRPTAAAPPLPSRPSTPAQITHPHTFCARPAQVYKSKAVQDIAVARGRQPFAPLPAFQAAHFALQHGAGGALAAAKLRQLGEAVRQHAGGSREVALFGLAAGLVTEEEVAAAVEAAEAHAQGQDQAQAADAEAGAAGQPQVLLPPVLLRQDTAQAEQRPGSSSAAGERQQAAAKAPLVLYHSRRRAPAQARDAVLASLEAFAHSRWHAAYLRSAARSLDPPPNPLALLPSVCWEVQDLLLSVPGVPELLRWVQGGGAAAGLRGADLGMPLAENQVGGRVGRAAVGAGGRGGEWADRGVHRQGGDSQTHSGVPVHMCPELGLLQGVLTYTFCRKAPAGAAALPAGGGRLPAARPPRHTAALRPQLPRGRRLLPASPGPSGCFPRPQRLPCGDGGGGGGSTGRGAAGW